MLASRLWMLLASVLLLWTGAAVNTTTANQSNGSSMRKRPAAEKLDSAKFNELASATIPPLPPGYNFDKNLHGAMMRIRKEYQDAQIFQITAMACSFCGLPMNIVNKPDTLERLTVISIFFFARGITYGMTSKGDEPGKWTDPRPHKWAPVYPYTSKRLRDLPRPSNDVINQLSLLTITPSQAVSLFLEYELGLCPGYLRLGLGGESPASDPNRYYYTLEYGRGKRSGERDLRLCIDIDAETGKVLGLPGPME